MSIHMYNYVGSDIILFRLSLTWFKPYAGIIAYPWCIMGPPPTVIFNLYVSYFCGLIPHANYTYVAFFPTKTLILNINISIFVPLFLPICVPIGLTCCTLRLTMYPCCSIWLVICSHGRWLAYHRWHHLPTGILLILSCWYLNRGGITSDMWFVPQVELNRVPIL